MAVYMTISSRYHPSWKEFYLSREKERRNSSKNP